MSGFELEKIHHQELAHSSPKSLLQPFGSAQGDFYLRFFKHDLGKKGKTPEAIDEHRFETIIVETTIKILAERAGIVEGSAPENLAERSMNLCGWTLRILDEPKPA